MSKIKILYAGDSEVGGPANYLLGILNFLKFQVVHIPPGCTLDRSLLHKERFDAIILSDFLKTNLPESSQKAIAEQVRTGTGLLMVGGWNSFSGHAESWRGTSIEKILPVTLLAKDDRTSFPGGAVVCLKQKHSMFRSLSFQNPSIICGLNKVNVKEGALVLLVAKKIVYDKRLRRKKFELALDKFDYPLLVIDKNPKNRIAAFTTDLAPHWCGGLVDWGSEHRKLPVNTDIQIEVGNLYIQFVSALVSWLVRTKI